MSAADSHTLRAGQLAALIALSFATGCRSISQRTLSDTEGRKFSAECDRDGECKLKQVSGEEPPSAKPALKLSATGRLLGVCNVAGEDKAPESPADCRALQCDSDADCPPSHGQPDGSCVNQLCIAPTLEPSVSDAVMMCLAGTGLGRNKPAQIGLFAMALNCGSPCVVPKPCRQP